MNQSPTSIFRGTVLQNIVRPMRTAATDAALAHVLQHVKDIQDRFQQMLNSKRSEQQVTSFELSTEEVSNMRSKSLSILRHHDEDQDIDQ